MTPELSLAWKVQWLITDSYPQAKDLYDAVLLAERTPLRYDLLRQVLIAADRAYERLQVTLADITSLDYISPRTTRTSCSAWQQRSNPPSRRHRPRRDRFAVAPTTADAAKESCASLTGHG